MTAAGAGAGALGALLLTVARPGPGQTRRLSAKDIRVVRVCSGSAGFGSDRQRPWRQTAIMIMATDSAVGDCDPCLSAPSGVRLGESVAGWELAGRAPRTGYQRPDSDVNNLKEDSDVSGSPVLPSGSRPATRSILVPLKRFERRPVSGPCCAAAGGGGALRSRYLLALLMIRNSRS
jgi:hypothetical protein